MTNYDYDSALGTNPTCDVCGIYIKVGDKVIQSFRGTVIHTHPNETELGIKEESYSLIHVDCQKKVN